MSAGVGRIGQEFLRIWDELVKIIGGGGQDWSGVSVEVAGIGHECLWERAGFVKNICRNEWKWSRMSVKVGRIGQEHLREWLGLIKCAFGSGQDCSKVGRSRMYSRSSTIKVAVNELLL